MSQFGWNVSDNRIHMESFNEIIPLMIDAVEGYRAMEKGIPYKEAVSSSLAFELEDYLVENEMECRTLEEYKEVVYETLVDGQVGDKYWLFPEENNVKIVKEDDDHFVLQIDEYKVGDQFPSYQLQVNHPIVILFVNTFLL